MFYGWCYSVQYHSFEEFVCMDTKYFSGFSMAIFLDCLHSVVILFSMKYLFSIVSSRMWDLEPRFFSCFSRTSSLPEAFLFFSIATPFLYSSSLKGYTIE